MTEPIIEFKPSLVKLSKNESEVLKLLVEAGKLIAPVYLEQEREAKQDITKKEIEKTAKKDLEILSPYTAVEKINGKLVITPYHIKYTKLLAPIASKLEEAANVTDNKDFGNALKIQAKSLLNGEYERAIAAWLKMKPYILDISIGPLQHFDDKIFSSKASYYAWVGVVDAEGTERLNNYKAVTLSVRRKAILPKERIDSLERVKAKVLDVVVFSGGMARTKFVGINLPMDPRLFEAYGSEITLFNQPNDLRLKEQIQPTFNKVFSREFKQGFSEEDLRRGYLRNVALHELAHSYLYYRNAAKNLQDLFACIHELSATTLGLIMAGSLLLKDRITNKQLESMMIAFISRALYLKERKEEHKPMANYALGSAIFINFLLESGALKQYKGLLVPSFTKIFMSIHELFDILEGLQANGAREDAESFIKKYNFI